MSSQALCVKLSVLFGLACHYFTKRTDMASKQWQAFIMCVLPCPRYLTGGDTHTRERWLWALQCASPVDAPIPPGVLSRGCSGSRSPGLWSRCCRGTAKAAVLGFAKGSVSGGRDGHCLFSAFTWQIQFLVSWLGSTRSGYFRLNRGTYMATIWFWGITCCKC